MAIKITKAKDCAEPFPVDGFKCEHVEGVGKITYADSITALKGGLGSKHALKTCEYNINHKTKAGGWKDIPADCFKNGKNGTMKDIVHSFYTKESAPPADIKQAVFDAVPAVLREAFKDEVKWNSILGEINLDRLFSGDRRFLRRRVQDEQNVPVIGIGVPVQANCNIKTDIVSIRSIVSALAVEILEGQGYQVEIFAVAHETGAYYSDGQRDGVQVLKIKGAGEVMAQSSILNATSGWAFRTAIFGMIQYGGNYSGGLGSSCSMTQSKVDKLKEYLPQLDDFMMLNCYPTNNNRSQAIKEAVAELVRIVKPYMKV